MAEGTAYAPASPVTPPEAIAHARDVVKRSGTSFGPGMRILSENRRNAMYAVYAFCREIDDIADEEGAAAEKHAALDEWRAEIEHVYAGTPTTLIGQALSGPVAQFHLPKEEFILLIEGMEMDADGPIRAPSFETYLAYCRRVAGAVGMLSMRIFGAGSGPYEDKFALALANAFQTTNILRDVEEDRAIGRIYLPRELLSKHGIADPDPETLLDQMGLRQACAELGAFAHDSFAEARQALAHFDWRDARPALLMMGIYERYWQLLNAQGWDPATPVRLSKLEKVWIALRYAVAPPLKSS